MTSNNRVISVTIDATRIGVSSPVSVYYAVSSLLDAGYTSDQIVWED